MVNTDELNNTRQAILSTIELHGIEAAQAQFINSVPDLSIERRKMLRIFAELEQDQASKWGFPTQ